MLFHHVCVPNELFTQDSQIEKANTALLTLRSGSDLRIPDILDNLSEVLHEKMLKQQKELAKGKEKETDERSFSEFSPARSHNEVGADVEDLCHVLKKNCCARRKAQI